MADLLQRILAANLNTCKLSENIQQIFVRLQAVSMIQWPLSNRLYKRTGSITVPNEYGDSVSLPAAEMKYARSVFERSTAINSKCIGRSKFFITCGDFNNFSQKINLI